VRRVADNEYELTVRHDTNNPRHRLWFYFKVTNARAGQRVLIHMVNFSKTKSLYRDGMSPLVRSSSSTTWERIHPKSVFYYKQKDRPTKKRDDAAVEDDGRDSPEDGEAGKKTPCVLSIVYTFESKEAHWFAYSYPFGYTMQQHLLDALERRRLPYVKRELLCRTLQNRRCDVLTIGDDVSDAAAAAADATKSGGDAAERPKPPAASVTRDGRRRSVVMITCRVHPGETPCSHTLRGFIDFVTGDSPAAVKLRERVTFVVVPMLNPDGCALGNYRTDSMGVDLNRAWRNADVRKGEWVGTGTFAEHKAAEKKIEQYPTLRHAMALARKYANSDTHALEFYIDIHAHSTSKSSFFFVNNPHDEDDVERWERIAALPKLMDHNCAALEAPGFSLSACRFCSNPDKAGAGRRAIGDMSRAAHIKRHGAKDDAADADEDKSSPAMCYTLEMSFYNAPSRSRQWSTSTSNEESYERHGVGLAHAFVDYYRLRPPTEQRVEGILRRVDASAKVSRGSDQAAAWTKGDLMFGFGTQIFADGGGAHKPWHKNGAKEARAALNAREPSFLRWIAQRAAMTPKNVASSSPSPPGLPNASKTQGGAKSPSKTAEKAPSSGKKATSSVGKHRRNGSPAGTGAKKEKGSSPSGNGPGKGIDKGGDKTPGEVCPTAFEFVAIPTAPAPTRDANLAGKRGVGRAKLRARRNAPISSPPTPTPTPEPAAIDDDVVDVDGPPTETERSRARDRALRIPSTTSPSQTTPGDVDASLADESYGLAADLARARVDVAGAFVPRSDGAQGLGLGFGTDGRESLYGSSSTAQLAASVGIAVGVGVGSAEPARRRARPAPRPPPPPMYPWEEDVDRFGGVSADVRRLRSA